MGRILRFLNLFLIEAVLCMGLLTGCGQQTDVDRGSLEPSELWEEDYAVSEEYIVVGFVQVGSESDWRLANTQSYRDVFTEENGYYLILEDGQQKQENQLKSVRSLILQQVDYIILDPIVENGWDAVLQEAKDAGIPVILADRMAEVEDEDLYTCWVGSDFYQEGVDAGEWLAQYIGEENEETVNIVMLQGTIGSSSQIGRTEGFLSVAETRPDWEILELSSGEFTQSKGKEVMEYFLEKYNRIDVVVSENDNMTFGAIEAIEEAGLTTGPGKDITIISYDAVKDALTDVSEGKINAVFECNPLLGSFVENIISDLEAGKEVEKIQYVEEAYFDSSMYLEDLIKNRTY